MKRLLILPLIILTNYAQAQDINDLTPNDSITTESPEVVVIVAPPMILVGESGAMVEKPNMDVVVKPQPPYITPGEFSAEFVENLVLGQTQTAIKRGLLPEKAVIKRFYSKRSAKEDLELYSMTIALHQRAILEGRDVNYYLDQVKAGKISVARLKKDIDLCGLGFEIYPDTKICSQFKDHQEAEQHYYHSKLTVFQLSDANQKLQASCGSTPPTAKLCVDQGSIKDGSGGFLWKAEADPKARCKNGTTILLAKDQASITEIELLDVNQNMIFKPSYFGKLDDGRPRFCAEGRPGSSFSGPLYVKYGQNCKTVSNPAVRED